MPDFDVGQWIQIWVWMGVSDDSIDGNPSAYVYDSDSNGVSYDVDLYIGGYLVNGPSWPY